MVRTTVVGTYPRIGETSEEQALRRGIARLDRGEIVEAELQAIERDTVREVLREQNEIGIDLVTDGQISWYDSQPFLAKNHIRGDESRRALYRHEHTHQTTALAQSARAEDAAARGGLSMVSSAIHVACEK